jgi:hypothetical protein
VGYLFCGKKTLIPHYATHIYWSMKVFKKVEKQLPQLTTLDLQYVSPELLKARNLELAVPGMCHEENEFFPMFILDYRDISERKGNHYDYKLCS